MNGWVDESKLVYHPIPVRPNQTEHCPSRKSPALLSTLTSTCYNTAYKGDAQFMPLKAVRRSGKKMSVISDIPQRLLMTMKQPTFCRSTGSRTNRWQVRLPLAHRRCLGTHKFQPSWVTKASGVGPFERRQVRPPPCQ
jgi:hypothetical protein